MKNNILMAVLFSLCALQGFAELEHTEEVQEGVHYHVIPAPPRSVQILWLGEDGKALRSFPRAFAYLESKNHSTRCLMNGGIFEPKGIPSGLLIQDGKTLNPLNPKDGKGNFFLKPNGVLLIGKDRALIMNSALYHEKMTGIRFAVQSGPLLLEKGVIHPAFRSKSTSRLHRNGVGVRDDGMLVLVMTDIESQKLPNLHEFAEYFRSLGCKNALFLDGDLSQMQIGEELGEPSNYFGSIIAILGEE